MFHLLNLIRRKEAPVETNRPELRLHIRWMIRVDMPAVLEIEAAGFESPWKEGDFIRCLRQRNCIGLVARDMANDRVAGFCIYENCQSRLNVLNFAVATYYRRRAVGRAMIDRLKSKFSPRRRMLTAEVRERNLPAQQFFRAMGFRAVATLRSRFEDTDEDAYLFRLTRDELPFLAPRFSTPRQP